MKASLKSAMLLMAAAFTAPHAQTFVRKPFLQLGTPTKGSVCWKLSAAASLTVKYGTDSTSLNKTTAASANAAASCVQLDSLQPGTKYYYEVYNGSTVMPGGTPQYIKTGPAIGTRGQKYSFWLLGDFGVGGSDRG